VEIIQLFFFYFNDDKKVAITRVLEIVTGMPNVHCLAVGLSDDQGILGGESLKKTTEKIKEKNGFVIVDHPYFATFNGNYSVQDARKSIDALEFNGQIRTKNIFSALEFATTGCFIGAGIEQLVDFPFNAFFAGGTLAGITGLSLSAYMNHCNNLVLKRAPVLDLPVVGSSDANTPGSMGKTRTRVFLKKEETLIRDGLIKNIMNNVIEGNYEVLSEKENIFRIFDHILKGYYSQLRGRFDLLYKEDSPTDGKGLPSA
jgi:hypothetical protein